ncbi:MAG TPA: diguanylate cyclase [Actinomycetota bacterium]
MFRVLVCLTDEHTPWLVAVAGSVCVVASCIAFQLLRHATEAQGLPRFWWLLAAAFSTGAGIWSTHFIAMLAYDPGVVVGYEAGPTFLSLGVASGVSALALALVVNARSARHLAAGGLMLGLGIASMHYIGMAGVEIPGRFEWDPVLVTASVAFGIVLSPIAFLVFAKRPTRHPTLAAGLVLACAICTLHFTAMAGAQARPDPAVAVSGVLLSRDALAAAIAIAMLAILKCDFASIVAYKRIQAIQHEAGCLKALANSAVEALAVCDGGRIIEANDSLADLLGLASEGLRGGAFLDLIPPEQRRAFQQGCRSGGETPIETHLTSAAGETVPVEVFVRPITYGGREHTLFAIRDLRERKRAEAQIRFLAHHDALTGLKNRASLRPRLEEEIARTLRSGIGFAILYVDLDRFKPVNDTLGHAAGDDLLKAIAQRLAGRLRETDAAFRLGGDEFVIVQTNVHDRAGCATLARDIIESVSAPIEVLGHAVAVGASIGIALCPGDGLDADALLRRGDAALYRAKAIGRGVHCFAEADRERSSRDQNEWDGITGGVVRLRAHA